MYDEMCSQRVSLIEGTFSRFAPKILGQGLGSEVYISTWIPRSVRALAKSTAIFSVPPKGLNFALRMANLCTIA